MQILPEPVDYRLLKHSVVGWQTVLRVRIFRHYSTLLLHVLSLVCLDLKGAFSFDLGEALRGGPLPFR